jgi:hypothetical protein
MTYSEIGAGSGPNDKDIHSANFGNHGSWCDKERSSWCQVYRVKFPLASWKKAWLLKDLLYDIGGLNGGV